MKRTIWVLNEPSPLPPLDAEVQEVVLLIYEDLSSDDLLEKCLGENNNESFNCVAPKHIYRVYLIFKLPHFLATSNFNDGFT